MNTAINGLRIAIFGIGPSGMVAAAAALRAGANITLISKTEERSQLFGCQYLHAPIPGYEDVPKATVDYSLTGTPDEYREKVYGQLWDGKTSPEDLIGTHDAWDIRETYHQMYERIVRKRRTKTNLVKFIQADISPLWLMENNSMFRKFDAVISTIPAPQICGKPEEHSFQSHEVYAKGDTRPDPSMPDNTVVCDGTGKNDWYRYARVFGYSTVEWPSKPPKLHHTAAVKKPLSHDCGCFPSITRMGRYGAWRKGVLVHEVYGETLDLMWGLDGI
jgi:hypothetical protein